jgi:hypothetical protein
MEDVSPAAEATSAETGASSRNERDAEALRTVASILRKLRYGTILLVVHDGEVVQIEAAEKIRMR